MDRDIGEGAIAARRHGRASEGSGGLFARDLPKARKPADGEPSETEPVPLADPQGTKALARCRQFQDFNAILS